MGQKLPPSAKNLLAKKSSKKALDWACFPSYFIGVMRIIRGEEKDFFQRTKEEAIRSPKYRPTEKTVNSREKTSERLALLKVPFQLTSARFLD